jgi:predicted anti-sigma-YlaC factor YlaD
VDQRYHGKGGCKLNISCNLISDLIPLVKDGVASEDSVKVVNEHIKGCESCKNEFETFEAYQIEQLTSKDEKIVFAIKRGVMIARLINLMAGAIVGVALSNSMGMFYNFIIMPIVGAISLYTFKKKWYLAPIVIFAMTYLIGVASDAFAWDLINRRFYFSVIYSVLVVLGIIIAKLLRFAFRKEGGTE